jgi:F-type H+-transporting ATPase subunit gamma
MEVIATSRIGKAQARMKAAKPYADEITSVLSTLAGATTLDHPLLVPRATATRAAVVIVTSDKGMCGGYNSFAIKEAERLQTLLREQGKTPVLYVVGRKGVDYYKFRNRPIAASWVGFSDQPSYTHAAEIGKTVVEAFKAGGDDTPEGVGVDGILGVDEIHVVSTEFHSMLSQDPVAHQAAPMVVDVQYAETTDAIPPAYDFEPSADALLDALLPKYLNTRIFAALLESAASELAARQRAMKSATDNANELIKTLSREANQARQAQITQEISEIVGGANALADAGSDE